MARRERRGPGSSNGASARANLAGAEAPRISREARICLRESLDALGYPDKARFVLNAGERGVVKTIGEDGGAWVKFCGRSERRCVQRQDFGKLEVLEPAPGAKAAITACVDAAIVLACVGGAIAGSLAAVRREAPPAGGAQPGSLRRLIQEPEEMFGALGFVSAPLVLVSLQGFLKLCLQMLLYLKGDAFSLERTSRKLANEDLRLSKASIAFQALGLAMIAHAYVCLACTLSPWESWDAFCAFAHAVSQHIATITLLVSVSTNMRFVDIDEAFSNPAEYSERSAARCLITAGVLVGLPLWLVLVAVVWLQVPLFLASAAYWVPLVALLFVAGIGFSWSGEVRVLSAVGAAAAWLAALVHAHGAWLLAGGVALEMAGPLMILVLVSAVLDLPDFPQLWDFIVSMQCAYAIVLLVPAVLLGADEGVGLFAGAQVAAMGKQMAPFCKYTFLASAQDVPAGIVHGQSLDALWWSQFLSLLT